MKLGGQSNKLFGYLKRNGEEKGYPEVQEGQVFLSADGVGGGMVIFGEIAKTSIREGEVGFSFGSQGEVDGFPNWLKTKS